MWALSVNIKVQKCLPESNNWVRKVDHRLTGCAWWLAVIICTHMISTSYFCTVHWCFSKYFTTFQAWNYGFTNDVAVAHPNPSFLFPFSEQLLLFGLSATHWALLSLRKLWEMQSVSQSLAEWENAHENRVSTCISLSRTCFFLSDISVRMCFLELYVTGMTGT